MSIKSAQASIDGTRPPLSTKSLIDVFPSTASLLCDPQSALDTPTMMIPPQHPSHYTYSNNSDIYTSDTSSDAMSKLIDNLSSSSDLMSWSHESLVNAASCDASDAFLRTTPEEVISADSLLLDRMATVAQFNRPQANKDLPITPTVKQSNPSIYDVDQMISSDPLPVWLNHALSCGFSESSLPSERSRSWSNVSQVAFSSDDVHPSTPLQRDDTSPPQSTKLLEQIISMTIPSGSHLPASPPHSQTSTFTINSDMDLTFPELHSCSPSSTAFSSSAATPDVQDEAMHPFMDQCNLASSLLRPYPATASSRKSRTQSPKKRKASGPACCTTQNSSKKLAKSFRRFSSLSKESSDIEDGIKSGQSSSMSYSVSQKILIKAKSSTQDEEIVYPNDQDLLQKALMAKGPEADSKNDPPIEAYDNAVQRTKNGDIDLYTPRWSRGTHRERDGWCHLCEKGGWYSMKRSQYLYHLQYDHGVSSQKKKVFDPPQAVRIWDDAVGSTEVLCGNCNSWIPICFGPVRKRNFKVYFKHIHACQRMSTSSSSSVP
jgi:hypothetical protein